MVSEAPQSERKGGGTKEQRSTAVTALKAAPQTSVMQQNAARSMRLTRLSALIMLHGVATRAPLVYCKRWIAVRMRI